MRLKVAENVTYPEARKLYEQKHNFTFSKLVKSLAAKPETKTTYTQYSVEDSNITESSKVILAKTPKTNLIFKSQCSTANKFAKQNEFIIK